MYLGLPSTVDRNKTTIFGFLKEKQGLGCRVGNGSTIYILEDPWLPLEQEAYVQTDNPSLQNQMVASLRDEHGSWDLNLIMDVFDSRDANVILSIPLNYETQDTW